MVASFNTGVVTSMNPSVMLPALNAIALPNDAEPLNN